jgi:phage-related protein
VATPLAEAFVRVRADTSSFKNDVRRGFDDADSHGRGRRAGSDAGAGFSSGLSNALQGIGNVTGKLFDLLGSAAKWTAFAGGIAAVGAAAASAAGYLVAVAAAIAPVGGLLAALPGIALVGASAFGVWRLATGGLGEAMGAALSGNAEALAAAMGKLSAGGVAFVDEFTQVIPLLKDFKAAAQDAFLSQIAGELAGWAWAIGGLKPAVKDLASEFGGLVRTFFMFGTAQGTIVQLDGVLRDTHSLVGAIHGALQPLLQGFVDLGAVGSSWLAGMSGGLQDVLTRFGEWMSRVASGGQALAWMDGALVVLKQLGALVKDVWDIFDGLMDAARTAGGDVLGVLGQLVDAFAKWVKSAQGQDVLVTVFTALNKIGAALLPVIAALGGAIAAIAPAAAALATALGPVLAAAISALGPAIAAVGPGVVALIQGLGTAISAIAPALLPLGAAIAAAFGILRPLLAAIGPAIAALLPGVQTFFLSFAQGLAQLVPALSPLGAAIGGILAALAPLLPVIGQLAALIATSLAGGVQAILPSLQLLVASFGQALVALSPVVPLVLSLAASLINSLVPALAPLLPQIASLIASLVSGLVPALTPLIPIIGQIVGVIGQAFVGVLGELIAVVLQILPPLSEAAVLLGQALLQALLSLLPHLPPLLGAFLSALPAIAALIPPLVELAVSLLPRFTDALVMVLPLLPELIRSAISLTQAWLPLVPLLADLARELAPHIPLFIELAAVILKDVLPAVTQIVVVVARMVNETIGKFLELYNRLVGHSIIPDLVNGIGRWISGLPDMFARWFGQAKDWAIGKFNELVGWISGLPGMIVGALGNMGSLLGGVGHDLIIGLWNGMVGMWQWFKDSIYNFFAGIMPQWVKDALGIASPSKLFAAIGKELPAGLAIGMDVGAPMVKAASERMAEATVGTFTAPSPAPAFGGTFGNASTTMGAPGRPAPAAIGGVTIENVNVQGVLDPRDPMSYRRLIEQLREALRQLEQEGYANV